MSFHTVVRSLVVVALALVPLACGEEHEHGGDCVVDEAALAIDGAATATSALVDCTVTTETGYSQGNPFAIDVVIVDDEPVEIATGNAYWVMKEAAAADGVYLAISSGFRTMAEQEYFYSCYINCNCNNCNLAAVPGYSNHQSGHALDLNTSSSGVLNWLNAHGADFGFYRTVSSEPWHWEWWGGGPGGGICGITDPECESDPWLNTCSGTVIQKCVNGQYETGDCGFFGAGCSTLGGDAHCVHPYCFETGENSQFCATDTKLATCEMGAYSEGDCAYYGGTCTESGGYAHCVHPYCLSLVGGEDGTSCMGDGTQDLLICSLGVAEIVPCGYYGGACSTTGEADHCIHPYCNLLVGSEEGTACGENHQLITCSGGNAEITECGAFGGACSTDGSAHCVHPYCVNIVGAEDGTACTHDGQLLACEAGAAELVDCAQSGGCVSTDSGASCADDVGDGDGDDDDGSSDDGSTDDGSSDDGSTDDGSSDDGSTDDDGSNDAVTDDGATDDGSSDDGSTDDGSSDDGSTDDDGSNDAVTDDGTTDDGSSDDDGADDDATDDGATGDGDGDEGSADDGSTNDESTNDDDDDTPSCAASDARDARPFGVLALLALAARLRRTRR